EKAAGEALAFLLQVMTMMNEEGVEWSACVSATEAARALMDGVAESTRRLRDAIRLAGRVLGELIPLGKTRLVTELLQTVVRELPIWSFRWSDAGRRAS